MKKTWSIFCVVALLALSLAGCAKDMTPGTATQTPGATPSQDIHGTADSGDLAGEDGMVDGEADKTDTDHADDSPLEKVGDGVRDAADDLGDAARDALDDAGRAAKDAGRDAKDMIENK